MITDDLVSADHALAEDLLSAAKHTPFSRAGIAALAARISESNEDVAETVRAAVDQADGHSATCLLLAAAVMGKPCDVEVTGRAIPLVTRREALLPIVVYCVGDRVAMLIGVVKERRLDGALAAVLLALAAHLIEDGEFPDELLVLLRRHCRMARSPDVGLMLGIAAHRVGDPHVLEVAGTWARFAEGYEDNIFAQDLETARFQPILDQLPEQEVRAAVVGFTVRRAVKKVGRNEPCPCGSGGKYKKCCMGKDQGRLADPSPVAGVTMEEYRAKAHQYMSPSEFRGLSPERMAALGVENLPTPHLIAAFQTWSHAHFWEQAEQALDVLETRDDLPCNIEGYRVDLLCDAMHAGAKDVALRLSSKVDLSEFDDIRFKVELMRPTAETLSLLEEQAREGLGGDQNLPLIELAFTLLEQYPALGSLVARGVVTPDNSWDSENLLEEVEEARDLLQLPPGDRALEIYDALLGERAKHRIETQSAARVQTGEHARVTKEADDLRRQLQGAARRSNDLEERLARATAALAENDRDQRAAAPLEGPAPEQELRRLRNKVTELKGLVSASHTERKNLRTQLAEASTRLGKVQEDAASSELPQASDAQTTPLPQYARPLIPKLSPAAERALRAVKPSVSASALRLIAELATGQAGPSAHVKRLEQTGGDVWSARVGIHYRLLFAFRGGECELDVRDLVSREDYERAIKSH